MKSAESQLPLASQGQEASRIPPAVRPSSPLSILESAINAGITHDNVSVVKELIAMCREQRAEDAKAAFAKAFFQLRRNMPEIYADKEAKDRSGNPVYSYCSEEELSKKLEPHLMSHGFAMLFGQSEREGRITVNVTLMHEQGHSELREFTVRTGAPNAMKDAAMCDAGAATTAWRHLMIKMFGLKSRISDRQDARLEGEPISPEQAQVLREMVKESKSDEKKFLAYAQAATYEEISVEAYDYLFSSLQKKLGVSG